MLNKSNLNKGSLLSRNGSLNNSTMQKKKGSTDLKVHAKSGSTREMGDKAEAKVDKHFTDCDIEVEATKNSGALNFDGDRLIHLSSVEGDYIRAEVKKRKSTGFTVQKDHWEDINRKAVMHGGIPAIVSVNENDDMLITMNVKEFAQMIQSLRDG